MGLFNKKALPSVCGSTIPMQTFADLKSDFHLSDVDFVCEFYATRGTHAVRKSDQIYVDNDNYIAMVDTNKTGRGKLFCRLTAWIPDERVQSGLRKESVEFDTGEVIY